MEEQIIISNIEGFEKAKKAIIEAGSEKLHVITDFDKTLTKAFVNGKEFQSVISILRDNNFLTLDYPAKAKELYAEYHPTEISLDISEEEKRAKMMEWWTTHFNLLIESKLNIKDIEKVVDGDWMQFREGVLEFLDFLKEKNIPLIILSSGGLGKEAISLYLKKEGKLYENIHIIANEFIWDEKGFAVGIRKPIIHIMNKDETSVAAFDFYDSIKERKNVILIGDSLGDIGMIKGFQYENLIKIGFLNEKIEDEEVLDKYKKTFDVVILRDGSFEFINKFIKELKD